ncbi:hypothetical protein EXIGLDRAFT_840080 [Exidia glandulosa HHB12029]|uniref:Fork-head domain-containing protein n=1 Tax=Exidia glandulosa HHB12029 TaxID=1314781 RepID=A0A165EN24_EXIGL|nr:hypothetical protein EXIGLDRAFT_840080 [Exidia glandulosa HHB12029]
MARGAIGDETIPVEEIRDRIEEKFPGIDPDGKGACWRTLRHTLSNYHCFVRVPRPEHEPGKGDYWKVIGDSKESRSQRYKKSVRSAKRSASTTALVSTLEDVNMSERDVTYHQDEDYRHDDDWDEDVAIDSFHAADSRLPQLEQWRPQTSINAAPGFLPEISAMRHAFVSAPPARDPYNTSRLVWDNSAASDGLDDYTRSSRNNLPASGAPFVPYHILARREADFGAVPASGAGDSGSASVNDYPNPYAGSQALLYGAVLTHHEASYNGPGWTLEEDRRRQGEHLPPDLAAQLSRSTSSPGTGGIPAATLSPARNLSYLLN